MQAGSEIVNLDNSSAIERTAAAAGAFMMVAGSGAVAYIDPAKASFLPVCPLFTLTGLACPGCGLTRGFHALFNGDIITALDFNFLIPIWAVVFGWILISLMVVAIRGRGLAMWPLKPGFLWTFMIVLVAFGVLRNLPFYPLTILYP